MQVNSMNVKSIAVKTTPTQRKGLSFIADFIQKQGTPPTLREICTYMGYASIGSAQDLIKALRKKELLTDPPKQSARALVLSPLAYDLLGIDAGTGAHINSSANKNSKTGIGENKTIATGKNSAKTWVQNMQDAFAIPLLGFVPAGNPVHAIENCDQYIHVSSNLFPMKRSKQYFALRASGDSMINAGIQDNDVLVVESAEEGKKGDIVVAMLDELSTSTVKKLMHDKKQGWYLKPENPKYPILGGKSQPFEVIGKVVASITTFK